MWSLNERMEIELKKRFAILGFSLNTLTNEGFKVIGNVLKHRNNNVLVIYENKGSLRKLFNPVSKCIKKASNASNSALMDYLNFMIANKKKKTNFSKVVIPNFKTEGTYSNETKKKEKEQESSFCFVERENTSNLSGNGKYAKSLQKK